MEQLGTTVSKEPMGETPDDCWNSSWTAPKFFSDLSAFNVTHFASGRDNLEVVAGVTLDAVAHADDLSSWTAWENASTMLQIFYPKDSINPAGWPQGGSEFYAAPLDLGKARSVTFAYSVFFPSDFEWVKGGKLPGLYGGRTGCSGGDPALDCFSTRLMWRAGGAGELYLVKRATFFPALELTRFRFVVRAEGSADAILMQRATSICVPCNIWALDCPGIVQVFTRVMDTCQPDRCAHSPGVPDGCFLLEVDGKVVIDRTDVFYRDVPPPRDLNFTPAGAIPAQLDCDGGLSASLLGGLSGSGLVLEKDGVQMLSVAQADFSSISISPVPCDPGTVAGQGSAESGGHIYADHGPRSVQEKDEPIGFKGVFFRYVSLVLL
jgi:hypothetical protein